MGRFGGAAAALVLGFWSYASFVTFVGGRLNARLGASEGPRCRQLRGAVGHFPAREALEVSPPGRQTVLERLQAELPASNVEEHTEEVRLLRDQTALLAQELRLLREVLQDGAFLSQVEESLGLEGGQMTEPAQAAQQSPQPAKLPAQQATDTGIPTRSLEKIRFQDLIHTESGDGAATTSRGFRQAEAVKSLDHLSARVVERRRQGELPLGQVPSIG